MNNANTHRLELSLLASAILYAFAALPARADDSASPAAAAAPAAAASAARSNRVPPPPTAASAGEVQEVVITSERRTSSVQKTAASIAVKSGDEMVEAGQNGLGQMLEDVAGLSTNTQGNNSDSLGLSLVIRGVQPDVTAGGASSAPPTTAVYTDSVFSGIGGDYDIDRIEILRGPQGTLYGRSATSGVVSIITNDPRFKQNSADLLVEGGTAALKHESGDVNVALGDRLALRVAGNNYEHDGYYSKEGGFTHSSGARAKLLWQPTDDLRILFGATEQKQMVHTGGDVFVATGPLSQTTSTSTVVGQRYKSKQYWSQVDWNLGFADLTYIPSYRTWTTSGNQIIGADIILQTNKYPHDNFITQELRLTSHDKGPLQWLLGAFYYNNRYENQTSALWIHSGALTWEQDVNKNTKNLGVFAESTYAFTPATRATAGLRFDTTKVDTFGYYTQNTATPAAGDDPTSTTWFLPEVLSTATLTPDQGKLTFRDTTFKLRLEHDLDAAHSVYGTVSSGFLPGDSQFTTTSAGAVAMPYEQERLMAYEVGSKNRFLDNQLTVNASVFFYDYSGFQTTANTSGNAQNPTYAVVTAPAHMMGGEIEGRWRLTPSDTLSFGYAYIDARYHGASADFQTYVVQKRVPGMAPNTATLGFDHVFQIGEGSLKAHADARYQDPYDLTAMTSTETAYSTWNRSRTATFLNANLTWDSPSGTYSVTGYVRNIGNEKIRNSFSFSDESITLSDPRTVGLVLQAHY